MPQLKDRLAIDFYRQIGAKSMDEWMSFRLTGDTLAHRRPQVARPLSTARGRTGPNRVTSSPMPSTPSW